MFQSSVSLGSLSLGLVSFLLLLPNVCWDALACVLALLPSPHQEAPLQDRFAEIQKSGHPEPYQGPFDHYTNLQSDATGPSVFACSSACICSF